MPSPGAKPCSPKRTLSTSAPLSSLLLALVPRFIDLCLCSHNANPGRSTTPMGGALEGVAKPNQH